MYAKEKYRIIKNNKQGKEKINAQFSKAYAKGQGRGKKKQKDIIYNC